jgi:hypothetical protein
VLVAALVDTECDQHEMLADVDPVDHDGAELEAPEIAAHHLLELLSRGRDEATADGAPARSARREAGGAGSIERA